MRVVDHLWLQKDLLIKIYIYWNYLNVFNVIFFFFLGIRKELYIWSVETAQLVKCLDAHFARIIDIQPLTVGSWNSVITASIDRTVKVWNINYIFEQVHHIGGFHLYFFHVFFVC